MRKITETILGMIFGIIFGGLWVFCALKLTREREPWFTICTLLGLAVTITILSWLGHVSVVAAVWTFVGTGAFFVAVRCYFGKNSAMEMFAGPYVTAVLLMLCLPAFARMLEKRKLIEMRNQTIERGQSAPAIGTPSRQ